MTKLAPPLLLGLLLLLALGAAVSWAAPPPPKTVGSGLHFLPPYPDVRDRFGFDSEKNDPLTDYDVTALNAGWYSDWGAALNPPHPDNLAYAQLIRFTAGSDKHDPAQVTSSPNKSTIAQIAAAHPGSLWMMSNEPDSLYQGNPIYPDVYAHVYHEYYHYIKELDPTALIANGGIVQPTPCRMQYLDIVWDTYYQAYSTTMPVDVWNIHAFTLREVYGQWGASTPPGVSTTCGIDYSIVDSLDIDIFRENLLAFRQWMKDKGQQEKPLIISEYGVLWPNWLLDDYVTNPTAHVSHFMTRTFEIFLNEPYIDVGCPADDYRLVQAWAWYSLSDTGYNGNLFNPSTHQMTLMGQTFADYVAALPETLYTDLIARLWVDADPLATIPPTATHGSLTITLPTAGSVANLGKQPAEALVSAPLLGYQEILSLPTRYSEDAGHLPLPSLVITRPGLYNLSLVADPHQAIPDPRRWNNGVTITLDARTDLVISTTGWSIRPPDILSGVLTVTLTVGNEGVWPTPPVSGTLTLSNAVGSLLLANQPFSVPGVGVGAAVTLTQKVTLPHHTSPYYQLALEVDSDDRVDELDEGNNRVTIQVDARPDLLISNLSWNAQTPTTLDGALSITLTVANQGACHADPVSGVINLGNTAGTLLLPAQRFPIPAIDAGARATLTQSSALPATDEDFYRLVLMVDSDEALSEQNESNNQAQVMIPFVITTTLTADSTGALISNSGHLTFEFPAGAVTTTTEIRFTPLWVPDLPAGSHPLQPVTGFRLTAYRNGQPISLTFVLPITVTWQYTNTDVTVYNEERLGLARWAEAEGDWQLISCATSRRWPDQNRLRTCIQTVGDYAFGQRVEVYLPIVLRGNGT